MAASPPLLTARKLACERYDLPIFSPVDFTVDAGEILQVCGPNGVGKTTLLRTVAGLFHEVRGELLWRGQALHGCRVEFNQELPYIGHRSGVKSQLSPEQNLAWMAALHGQPGAITITEALGRAGLERDRHVPCGRLSAGQNRRVALARLYLDRQALWILDEPFTSIDHAGAEALEQAVIDHAQRGGCVLMTTHRPSILAMPGYRSLTLTEAL